MEKIIPFKKDILFNTNIDEITSISLDHNLYIENDCIKGNFIVNGDYKITKDSDYVNDYNYDLPFESVFDSKYDLANSNVNVSDFYYEVVDNKILSINIEITVDNVDEKRCVEEETITKEIIVEKEEVEEQKDYCLYKVYIVREDDTLSTIMDKYKITKEKLEEYNDLSNINVNDKIIIPIDES